MKKEIAIGIAFLLPLCIHAMESKQPNPIIRYIPNKEPIIHKSFHNLTVSAQLFDYAYLSKELGENPEDANAHIQIGYPKQEESSFPVPLPIILPLISYYALQDAKERPVNTTSLATWGAAGSVIGGVAGSYIQMSSIGTALGGLITGAIGYKLGSQKSTENYANFIQNIVETNKVLFTQKSGDFPITDVHTRLKAPMQVKFRTHNITIQPTDTPYTIATSETMPTAFQHHPEKLAAWEQITSDIVAAHTKQLKPTHKLPGDWIKMTRQEDGTYASDKGKERESFSSSSSSSSLWH